MDAVALSALNILKRRVTPAATPTVAPESPASVAALAGNGRATVTWAQSPVGYPRTGFTVTASPGGVIASVGPEMRSATVTGLSNGTAYTFTVTATNSHGTSPASTASNTVTPGTGPGALGVQGLAAWWDASQLVLADGAAVTSWPDVSGNGFTATQGVSANQPTYKATAGPNGRSSVLFTNQQALLTNLTQAAMGSAATIFVVAQLTASTSAGFRDQRAISNEQVWGDNYGVILDTIFGGGNGWRARTSSIFSSSPPNVTMSLTTNYVVSITTPGYMYVNGSIAVGNNPAPVGNTNPYYISGVPLSGAIVRGFQGYISEVAFFSGRMSDTDRHSIESYLGTRYGVTMVSS